MFTLEYSEIFMLIHPSLDKNKILLPLSVTIDYAKNKNKNSFQSIRNVLKPVHDERVSVKPSLFDQQRSRFLDHQPRFQRNQESKTLENIGDSRRFVTMLDDVPSKNRLLLEMFVLSRVRKAELFSLRRKKSGKKSEEIKSGIVARKGTRGMSINAAPPTILTVHGRVKRVSRGEGRAKKKMMKNGEEKGKRERKKEEGEGVQQEPLLNEPFSFLPSLRFPLFLLLFLPPSPFPSFLPRHAGQHQPLVNQLLLWREDAEHARYFSVMEHPWPEIGGHRCALTEKES